MNDFVGPPDLRKKRTPLPAELAAGIQQYFGQRDAPEYEGEKPYGIDIFKLNALAGQKPEITPLPKAQPVESQDPIQAIMGNKDRLRKLEGMKDIAEGMGAIGTGVRRGIMHTVGRDPNSVQPFVAEGIRTQIDEEKDAVSPETLASLEKVFGTMPQGITWTQLHSVLPSIARVQDTNAIDPYSARRLTLQEAAEARRNRQGDASLGLREQGMDNTESYRNEQQRAGIIRAYDSDARVKMVGQMETQAQLLDDLLTSGDQQAIKNAVVPLARLLGEKGALSDRDRAEVRTRLGIANRIEDWINANIGGQITPELVKSYRLMAQVAKDMAPKVRREVGTKKSSQYSQAYNIPEDEILNMLGVDSGAAPAEPGPSQPKQGKLKLPTGPAIDGGSAKTMTSPNGATLQVYSEEEAASLREMGWTE